MLRGTQGQRSGGCRTGDLKNWAHGDQAKSGTHSACAQSDFVSDLLPPPHRPHTRSQLKQAFCACSGRAVKWKRTKKKAAPAATPPQRPRPRRLCAALCVALPAARLCGRFPPPPPSPPIRPFAPRDPRWRRRRARALREAVDHHGDGGGAGLAGLGPGRASGPAPPGRLRSPGAGLGPRIEPAELAATRGEEAGGRPGLQPL